MVRAYFPNAFPGNLKTNTNYPPQADNQGGISGQGEMEFNVTGEQMVFNITNEEMEYN